MAWTWHLEGADGAELSSPAPSVEQPTHQNQSDAESWLGEQWRELADSGVTQVRLFEGSTEIYGPMPLAEA
jgi:hypothetical protein